MSSSAAVPDTGGVSEAAGAAVLHGAAPPTSFCGERRTRHDGGAESCQEGRGGKVVCLPGITDAQLPNVWRTSAELESMGCWRWRQATMYIWRGAEAAQFAAVAAEGGRGTVFGHVLHVVLCELLKVASKHRYRLPVWPPQDVTALNRRRCETLHDLLTAEERGHGQDEADDVALSSSDGSSMGGYVCGSLWRCLDRGR